MIGKKTVKRDKNNVCAQNIVHAQVWCGKYVPPKFMSLQCLFHGGFSCAFTHIQTYLHGCWHNNQIAKRYCDASICRIYNCYQCHAQCFQILSSIYILMTAFWCAALFWSFMCASCVEDNQNKITCVCLVNIIPFHLCVGLTWLITDTSRQGRSTDDQLQWPFGPICNVSPFKRVCLHADRPMKRSKMPGPLSAKSVRVLYHQHTVKGMSHIRLYIRA